MSETATFQGLLTLLSLSVIDRIEKIFKGIFDALLCGGKEVGITLKLRPTTPVHRSKMMDSVKLRRIRFPGMSPGEAWQFSRMVPCHLLSGLC